MLGSPSPTLLLASPLGGFPSCCNSPSPSLLGPVPSFSGALYGGFKLRRCCGLPPQTDWGIVWEQVLTSRPSCANVTSLESSSGAVMPLVGCSSTSPRHTRVRRA